MNDLLNWIENEAARGLSEGDTVAALTAIKWRIKDSPPIAKTIGTEPQSAPTREEIENIKTAILEDTTALNDTLWMPDHIFKGGTVVDYIDAILSRSQAVCAQQEAPQALKDEMLSFFLAFFDGWPADTQLTVTNLEALERARKRVAALTRPVCADEPAMPSHQRSQGE